jgi:hypothetical protein
MMSVFDYEGTYSFSFAWFPLSFITLTSCIYPKSLSVLMAFQPITNICFTVCPLKLSFSISSTIFKVSFVYSLLSNFNAFYFVIIFPDSLKAGLKSEENS